MPPKKSGAGKKKKLISNRGFSTVSIPKKKEDDLVQLDASIPEGETLLESNLIQANQSDVRPEEAKKGLLHDLQEEEWDLEQVEKQELQNLADQIRPKVEKEVARVLKVIEYERRVSKSLTTYYWTEQDLQQRIVDLGLSLVSAEEPQPFYESEEKIITKIATLVGILEGLGFRPDRIQDCLIKVKLLEFDQVIDWLFLNCDPEELTCQGPIVVEPTPPEAEQVESIVSPLPRLQTQDNQIPLIAPEFPTRNSATKNEEEADSDLDEEIRARILSYDDDDTDLLLEEEGTESNLKKEEDDLEEDQDANTNYAKLKLHLSELERALSSSKRTNSKIGFSSFQIKNDEWRRVQIEAIQKKLKSIEGDYTFRKPDAELVYRELRTELDKAILKDRLEGTCYAKPPKSSLDLESGNEEDEKDDRAAVKEMNGLKIKEGDGMTTETTNEERKVRHEDDKEDEEEEGMFGNLLEEMPTTETTETGQTVFVRDMALPKHFSGKTPKVALEETVRKSDKYATVVFKIISRGSRSFRASVTIRSEGAKAKTWTMQDVACYDQKQAFDYIATVALFEVSSTAVNKQLPLVFRDLWDELVLKKKDEDDDKYRGKLKEWKTIAEPRMKEPPSRDSRTTKAMTTSIEEELPTQPSIPRPEVSERIKADFAQRQESPNYQEMLQHRAKLPIASYRSFIMSTIEQNQCVVLCGETGCGKSTQVPSFIVEHDMRKGRNVKVYCTEPRRISAISLAQRVSVELGENPGSCGSRSSLVGYSIRLDSAVTPHSRIVYATTGIVLRMLEGRESLADLTHLIIDEIHERSIDSDFLLIILREILQRRKDLKVILMSATVDAEKFSAYMGNCPVITVPGRTFPVTPHYLEDVIELTQYRLTPTSDSQYVARSKRVYGHGASRPRKTIDDDAPPDEDEEPDLLAGGLIKEMTTLSKQSRTTLECMDQHVINYELIILLLEQLCFERAELRPFSNAVLIFLPGIESIRRLTDMLEGHPMFGTNDFLVLPLHSTISNENQGLVFNVPKNGIRKIVISTNIAETGVTIPDITAVIDTGKHREMRFDEKRQISRLVETFVAQSNAAQRRGRAGRVQEGVCFHLFSKQRHDTIMAEHPQPEMLRLSLQDLALRIKIMKIGNASIEEVLLRALDPPLQVNIQRAVSSLIEAKALTNSEEITPLGRHLAKLPMDVHLGKFLIMATIFNCLDAALTITAALNAKSPWLTPFGREAEADAVKRGFKIENSDFLTLYNAYSIWREASGNGYEREFCRKNFLSQQNLQEIEQGRQQYFSFLVDAGFIDISEQERRDLVSTRYGKSRTRFVRVPPELDTHSRDAKAVMACLAASMYPKLLIIDPQSGQMKTLSKNTPAAIHPSSVNFAPGRRIDFGGQKFVAFFTAMHTNKLYVWESGSVDERAVYLLCGQADFSLPGHSLSIDRKIKVRLEAKTSIAMRLLRREWTSFFLAKMKNTKAPLSENQIKWLELVKEALCSPPKDDEVLQGGMKKKKPTETMKVSVVRNA